MTPIPISDSLYILPLSIDTGTWKSILNPLLVVAEDGLALIDTGMPGQAKDIADQIGELGASIEDLTLIILTHQDIDHIGSAADLVDLTGAQVVCHSEDEPYINGELEAVKAPSSERLASNPKFAELWAQRRTLPVDRVLEDGDLLEIGGGVRVVFTPGHTPGHMSLYFEETGLLVAGDALTAEDGKLKGPNPAATPDMPMAMESVKKLKNVGAKQVLCYHGGLVTGDVQAQFEAILVG